MVSMSMPGFGCLDLLRKHGCARAAPAACCLLLQSQTDRLQSDVDAMRRRCAELAGRLQESQRALAQAQVRPRAGAKGSASVLTALSVGLPC